MPAEAKRRASKDAKPHRRAAEAPRPAKRPPPHPTTSQRSAVFRAPPAISLPPMRLPTVTFRLPRLPLAAWGAPPPAPGAGGKLVVARVKGDGRCLYRSIARSLADEEHRALPAHLETADADALRGLAHKAMCVDRYAEFMRRHVVEGSLRNYCAQMRAPTFYAGEAEILALSDALRLPIRVFLDTGRGLRNIATYGEHYKAAKTVRVLYNGTNHYNAVLKR